jgi:hypothetical protein
MLNFKDYVRKKLSHDLNMSRVSAIWVSKKFGKESTNFEDSWYAKESTEVARLTSDNVKLAPGISLCPFCMWQSCNYLCFVCNEILHTNETKLKFNENISFIRNTTIWQFLSRLSTNFTDNPRIYNLLRDCSDKRMVLLSNYDDYHNKHTYIPV